MLDILAQALWAGLKAGHKVVDNFIRYCSYLIAGLILFLFLRIGEEAIYRAYGQSYNIFQKFASIISPNIHPSALDEISVVNFYGYYPYVDEVSCLSQSADVAKLHGYEVEEDKSSKFNMYTKNDVKIIQLCIVTGPITITSLAASIVGKETKRLLNEVELLKTHINIHGNNQLEIFRRDADYNTIQSYAPLNHFVALGEFQGDISSCQRSLKQILSVRNYQLSEYNEYINGNKPFLNVVTKCFTYKKITILMIIGTGSRDHTDNIVDPGQEAAIIGAMASIKPM